MLKYFYFSLFFINFIFVSSVVSAKQVPLIIQNKHQIFIQEYWNNEKLTICIANSSPKDEIIEIFKWLGGKDDSVILKHWSVKKESSQCFKADDLVGTDILEFTIKKGVTLGLMKIQQPALSTAHIGNSLSSFKDINNNCSSPTISIKQPSLESKPDANNVITLTDNDINSYLELQMESNLPLPHLQLNSISSETYTIKKKEKVYVLKSHLHEQQKIVNSTQLTFETPKVTKLTMFIISGKKRFNKTGWQCFFRGVMVKP